MTDRRKRIRKIAAAAVILLLLLGFCVYENNHLVVTEYTYQNAQIPEALNDYRIVQISDLHNARFGADNHRLTGRIRNLEPDLIVLTGDLVDAYHTNLTVAAALAQELTAVAPVYFISGNHEEWLDAQTREALYRDLSDAGVILLENSSVMIGKGDAQFELLGIYDGRLQSNTLRTMTEENENPDVLTVLLAHEPQYLDEYARCGVNLVLTGHAHGGQFRLPWIGGVVAPDQGFFPPYTEGVFTQDNTTMIISRGLGNSVIPVRLFNDPEIVTVTLHS